MVKALGDMDVVNTNLQFLAFISQNADIKQLINKEQYNLTIF